MLRYLKITRRAFIVKVNAGEIMPKNNARFKMQDSRVILLDSFLPRAGLLNEAATLLKNKVYHLTYSYF